MSIGLGLAIMAAGAVGEVVRKEVKNYKETGEISRSAQNNITKITTKMVGKADLGGKLVDAIAKSVLK